MGAQQKAKMLAKNGADVTIRNFAGESPAIVAARCGLLDALRYLAQGGADIYDRNARGDTLLHLAARQSNNALISFLLDKGLSITEKNLDGFLPKDLANDMTVKEMLSNEFQQFDIFKAKDPGG